MPNYMRHVVAGYVAAALNPATERHSSTTIRVWLQNVNVYALPTFEGGVLDRLAFRFFVSEPVTVLSVLSISPHGQNSKQVPRRVFEPRLAAWREMVPRHPGRCRRCNQRVHVAERWP